MENIDNILNGELALNVRIKLNAVIDRVNSLSINLTEINEVKDDVELINQNLSGVTTTLSEIQEEITELTNIVNLLEGNPQEISELQTELNNIKDLLDSGTFGSITLTNDPVIFNPFIGDEILFAKENNEEQIDIIDEDNDIAITRGVEDGIYNPLQEEEWDSDESPKGTLWNADGYDNFKDVPLRNYTTFYEALKFAIGDYILTSDLIMYVPSINKYFKVKFTSWTSGGNGGGFSYIRQELNTSFYFNRPDNEYVVDIIDTNIQIARNTNGGWIFNPVYENSSSQNTPTGTLWNNDGWNDLSDVLDRTYIPLASLFENNFRNIPGNELIMKDTINNKYYLFKFIYWSVGNGGGFSYTRFQLDTDKLNEGVRFADGTIQKTATSPVKSKAFGTWKIVEKTGSSNVNLTEFVIEEEFTGVTVGNPYINDRLWDVFVDADSYPDIVASINNGNQEWRLLINGEIYIVYAYLSTLDLTIGNWDEANIEWTNGGNWDQENVTFIVFYNEAGQPVNYEAGDIFNIQRGEGGEPVRWFRDSDPDFRGAIIDYHAYIDNTDFTGGGTFIGNILISRDGGNYSISHSESFSGNNNTGNNAVLWFRDGKNGNEREVYFLMKNGDKARLRIHYIYKSFYGVDYYD
jgi:hypothetical protein